MPWSFPDNVPAVAQNWTEGEQQRCVDAGNAVLEETGDEEQAIFACIAAAGKEQKMNTKTFRGRMQLKADGQPGEFAAVFATLNVKDHDGDVTLPGAFTDGEQVRISAWGHAWDDLPVGRGEIHEVEEQAVVSGGFFLDTQAGKEHYQTVKALGDLQQWSYGFEVLDAEEGDWEGEKVRFLKKLKVFEVSPVMLGAGVGTRTTDIKVGARHTAKEFAMIQEIHDLSVALGAKCAEPTEDSQDADEGDGEGAGQDEAPDQGKSRSQMLSAVARMVSWLETVE
jgi:HK97 family phage prohead protease